MRDVLVLAVGWVLGIVTGTIAMTAWIELRHECMPHEPARCARAAIPARRPNDGD